MRRIIILSLILFGAYQIAYAVTVQPTQTGGTGIGTSTVGNNGLCLYQNGIGLNNSPIFGFTTCGGGGGGSGSFNATGTAQGLLLFTGLAQGTSSANLFFVTSTITANNLLNVIGTVSSTEARFTSSTFVAATISGLAGGGTLCLHVDNNGLIGTAVGDCGTSSGATLNGTDQGILIKELGNNATTSLTISYSSSTGVFTSGSSSLTNVSGTNMNLTGNLQVAKSLVDFNGNKYSTSTGVSTIRFNDFDGTAFNYVGRITDFSQSTVNGSTTLQLAIGVDQQVLFGKVGGGATTSIGITISSSTGVFTSGSSSLANVSGTNISVTGFGVFPTLVFTSASGTNENLTGSLQVAKSLVDFNGNKYSTSTGGASFSSGVDGQLLFGQLGGGATSSFRFSIVTSTVLDQILIGTSTANNPTAILTIATTSPIFTVTNNGIAINSSTDPTGGAGLYVLESGGSALNIVSERISNTNSAPSFVYRRARGTPAAMSAVQNADLLLQIAVQGFDGSSAYANNANIRTFAEGNFTAGSHGTSLDFAVTAAGGTSLTSRLRLDSFGNLGVNTTTPQARLQVISGATATTTLLVTGLAQQTADLFQVQSSTNQFFFQISSMGVASSSEFRSPSSTIGGLYLGTTCSGGQGLTQTSAAAGVVCFSPGGFSSGVDTQVLQGVVGGGATSSLLIQFSSSSQTLALGGLAATSSGLVFMQNSLASTVTSTLLIQGSTNQIGNLIQVQSSTGSASPFLVLNSMGQLMLGTSTAPASNTLLSIATTSPIFTVTNQGNVGIGSSTPGIALVVTRPGTSGGTFTDPTGGDPVFQVQASSGAPIFTVNSSGTMSFAAGYVTTSTGGKYKPLSATVCGTISMSTSSVGNSGSASTSLMSFTVPTSTLQNTGDRLLIFAGGTITNSAGGKQLQLVASSTGVFDTLQGGAIPVNVGGNWFMESRIVQNANSSTVAITQFTDSVVSALTDDSGDAGNKVFNVSTTLPFAINLYGLGGASNDIVGNYFEVQYCQAPLSL